MARYTAKKLIQLVISLLVLSAIVFFVSRTAPGNPLKAYYGEAVERMSPHQLALAEERLGLDDPLIIQYLRWMKNALGGNMGISYQYKQSVTEVIGQVAGNTFLLTAVSFILIFLLGLCLAVFCVNHEGSRADRAICRIGVALNSIPEFFAALILILFFSVMTGILPQSGATDIGGGGRIEHLILPVMSIVLTHTWYVAYLMRSRLSQEAGCEYVLMCRAKGLGRRQIMWKHCVKNILPSAFGIMATFLPHLLGGAYVVEMVFSYPGLGKLGVDSAQYHDYNMLMCVCLLTGAIVITVHMLSSVVSEKLSPEMKEERGQML